MTSLFEVAVCNGFPGFRCGRKIILKDGFVPPFKWIAGQNTLTDDQVKEHILCKECKKAYCEENDLRFLHRAPAALANMAKRRLEQVRASFAQTDSAQASA